MRKILFYTIILDSFTLIRKISLCLINYLVIIQCHLKIFRITLYSFITFLLNNVNIFGLECKTELSEMSRPNQNYSVESRYRQTDIKQIIKRHKSSKACQDDYEMI